MTQPMNPVDYVPSVQVQHVIKVYLSMRRRTDWREEIPTERGERYGVAGIVRELVALETNITDPDDLDELCAELVENAQPEA